jgi:signal transduction histidine kinase
VAAAFPVTRSFPSPRRSGALVVLTTLGTIAVVGLWAFLLNDRLPAAVEMLPPGDARRPTLAGHPVILVLQGAVMVMFAAAAYGFAVVAERERDVMMQWFAAGALVAAFARLHYLLYPSLYTDYVYTGDAFRLGFYLLLLVGAGLEVTSYWDELAESAATKERRRIARDLHDGLAQELAFIWADTQALKREYPANERVTRASAAAERALDESRRAIATFSRSPDEPLDLALTHFIEEIARRLDVRVRFDLESGIKTSAKLREDLLRVSREAVTNAARHGNATRITIRLRREGSLYLRITDDGRGFNPSHPRRTSSFGIISMKERVENHGGVFRVSSAVGQGTEVEVVVP